MKLTYIFCGVLLLGPFSLFTSYAASPLETACANEDYAKYEFTICSEVAKHVTPTPPPQQVQLPVPNAFYVGFNDKPIPYYGTLEACVQMAKDRMTHSSLLPLPNSILPKPEDQCISVH